MCSYTLWGLVSNHFSWILFQFVTNAATRVWILPWQRINRTIYLADLRWHDLALTPGVLIYSCYLENVGEIVRLLEVGGDEKAGGARTRWRLDIRRLLCPPASRRATVTRTGQLTADITATPAARHRRREQRSPQDKEVCHEFGGSLANVTECLGRFSSFASCCQLLFWLSLATLQLLACTWSR